MIPRTSASISHHPPHDSGGGSLLYLAFCAIASALGGLLFGYDLLVISGAKDLIVAHFQLSTLMEGWFVSSAMVGAMVAYAIAGTCSDHFGRKRVLLAASVFLCAWWPRTHGEAWWACSRCQPCSFSSPA